MSVGVSSSSTVTAEGARCAVHPERGAIAVCGRCGDYHCSDCHKSVGGRPLCASCRALPEVDYLEDTRRRLWGKRDGFVWYFGIFGSFGTLLSLPQQLAAGDLAGVVANLGWAGLSISYLTLVPWSRVALLFGSAALSLLGVVRALLGSGPQLTEEQVRIFGGPQGVLVFAVATSMVTLLIVLAAHYSPRNKLAFKLPVTDAELAKVYDQYLSNPLAQRAFWYGLVATMVPLASAITLVVGIVALRRSAPEAWPPRGGRKAAIAAIVISILALVGWAALFASIAMRTG